jgi:RecA-family ATPase
MNKANDRSQEATAQPSPSSGNVPIAPLYDEIPDALKALQQWVLWRRELRGSSDKPTKVPYVASSASDRNQHRKASATDPETWRSFEDALDAVDRRLGEGVGFVFSCSDPYVGIDLDACRNPQTGGLEPWAEGLVVQATSLGLYVEISPSGTGLHLIGRGTWGKGRRSGPIEVYDRERYFTVTGDRSGFSSGDVEADAGPLLDTLRGTVFHDVPGISMDDTEVRLRLDGIALEHRARALPAAAVQGWADDFLSRAGEQARGWWFTSDVEGKSEDRLKLLWRIAKDRMSNGSVDAPEQVAVEVAAVVASSERYEAETARRKWPRLLGHEIRVAVTNARRKIEAEGPPADVSGVLAKDVARSNLPTPADRAIVGTPTAPRAPAATASPSSFIDFRTLDAERVAEPQFIVDDWLPRGAVTLFAGHGGSGKSFIAMVIAVQLALGMDVLGAKRGGARERVMYISAEDDATVLKPRLRAICHWLNVSTSRLNGWLEVADWTVRDLAILFAEGRNGTGLTTDVFKQLKAEAEELKPSLVVLDNSSLLYGGNENVRTMVQQFVNSLRRLGPDGCAVLLLHHLDKNAVSSSGGGLKEGYSGSTGWHNSVRARWSLEHNEGAASRTLHLRKSNYGTAGKSQTWTWDAAQKVVRPEGDVLFSTERRAQNSEADARKVMGALVQHHVNAETRDVDPFLASSEKAGKSAASVLAMALKWPESAGKKRAQSALLWLESQGFVERRLIERPNRSKSEGSFSTTRGTEWLRSGESVAPTAAHGKQSADAIRAGIANKRTEVAATDTSAAGSAEAAGIVVPAAASFAADSVVTRRKARTSRRALQLIGRGHIDPNGNEAR